MTFAQKGSIAFAIIILGIVLDLIGFKANEIQTTNTIDDMKSIMTLIPAFGGRAEFNNYLFLSNRRKTQRTFTENSKED